MVDSEIPSPSKNEHTEIVGSTKLTIKERFYSYLRSHAPFNPAKYEEVKEALEDFFVSITDGIATDNNLLLVARDKMVECYNSILALQTSFPLPSPEGKIVTLKKYEAEPYRLAYKCTFKEGDIYVVHKGSCARPLAVGDLMFRVTRIEGNDVWVECNDPNVSPGRLRVGDTDSLDNLYYLANNSILLLPISITRLPVATFEDGAKYLTALQEQNDLMKVLYKDLVDIFKQSENSVVGATFRSALLDMRDSIDSSSNSALVYLNNLVGETYEAPKRARKQVAQDVVEQLQLLAARVLE